MTFTVVPDSLHQLANVTNMDIYIPTFDKHGKKISYTISHPTK